MRPKGVPKDSSSVRLSKWHSEQIAPGRWKGKVESNLKKPSKCSLQWTEACLRPASHTLLPGLGCQNGLEIDMSQFPFEPAKAAMVLNGRSDQYIDQLKGKSRDL